MYDRDSGYRGVDDDDDAMENYAMNVVDDDGAEDRLGGVYREDNNMRDDFWVTFGLIKNWLVSIKFNLSQNRYFVFC